MPWPPPKGWKDRLIEGDTTDRDTRTTEAKRKPVTERQVRFMSDLVEQRDVPEAVRREVERVVSYGTVSEARTLIEHLTGLPRLDYSVASAHQRRSATWTDCTHDLECAADLHATGCPGHADRPQAHRAIHDDKLMRLMDC